MEIKRISPIDKSIIVEQVAEGSTYEDLYLAHKEEYPYRVLAAKVDNKLESLAHVIKKPATIEFLDLRNRAANLVYQSSLSLIFLKAIEDVIGRTPTEIQNSLNKSLYTEIKTQEPITDQQLLDIENRMKEIVAQDIKFEETILDRDKAMDFLDKAHLTERKRLLESNPGVKKAKFYSLGDFRNFFYGVMVPSTGYIEHFGLKKYRRGALLMFPSAQDPNQLPPYVDEKKMYKAFSEATRWKSLLDISYVTDLNEKIGSGQMREIIQLSEALHEKKIVEIAEEITKKKKRIILIAGPSSSGKTTFARRLCIQLKVNGLSPMYLGTDDYFIDRDLVPLDEDGEKDFENLCALDVDLFNDHMNKLLAGEEVDLPEFDFIDGVKVYGHRITTLKKNQPVVIEGIHGLNDALTSHIDDREKYKIYISPLTQLAIDSHNRIPTTDARMLRRMVRDFKYRGYSARDTIATWPRVRKGEDKNIFPYNGHADVFFNSAHIYEMAVLKKYADPLLREIKREHKEYGEARRMLKYLEFFKVIEDDKIISNNSIIREFIGGSVFVD